MDAPFPSNYVWPGFLQLIDGLIDASLLADMTASNISQGTYPPNGKLYATSLIDSTVIMYASKSQPEAVGARFAVMVVPVQCGFALAMTLLIDQRLPFRNFLRRAPFLPAITSMSVVCVIWGTLFQFPTGPLNQIVGFVTFGMAGPINGPGEPGSSMPAIVLLSAWQAYGFQMVVYLAGLQSIPNDRYEDARLDGAKTRARFRFVTWPGLRQTNIFVIIITTIQAFKLFTQINILTQGGPRDSANTVVQ